AEWVEAFIAENKKGIKESKINFGSTLKQKIWEETLRYFSTSGFSSENSSLSTVPEVVYIISILERMFLSLGIEPRALSVKYVKGNFSEPLKTALAQLVKKLSEKEKREKKNTQD